MNQPTPKVSRQDIKRLIVRDFSVDRLNLILDILDEYGKEDWHQEKDRVQAAILKLCDGDEDKILENVQLACTDFRDVIVPAEYPNYDKTEPGKSLSENEKKIIFRDDLQQYLKWFNRK